MVRIWLNHWFSTAWHIIRLIREGEKDFYLIGTNENGQAVYRDVCDEFYAEPVLDDDAYVEYCLDFCKTHAVDVFMPRRKMIAVSRAKERFAQIGVRVMADDFPIVQILNQKDKAYELFIREQIGHVPRYRTVTTAEDFDAAYHELEEQFGQVCFKFIHDEGGKSYRLIDNAQGGYRALFKKQTSRISFADAFRALSERETFGPVMVMPYLPGEEISVDCLKTKRGIIMIPRVKGATRIEKIRYDEQILDMCRLFYEKISLETPCNIQFKMREGIPWFLEVNTRMSGGIQMACLAAGVNIPNIAVNQLLGIDKEWTLDRTEKMVSQIETPLIL